MNFFNMEFNNITFKNQYEYIHLKKLYFNIYISLVIFGEII